jgi:hypothetical protein
MFIGNINEKYNGEIIFNSRIIDSLIHFEQNNNKKNL